MSKKYIYTYKIPSNRFPSNVEIVIIFFLDILLVMPFFDYFHPTVRTFFALQNWWAQKVLKVAGKLSEI